MKRFLALTLVLAIATFGVPAWSAAATQQAASVAGMAKDSGGRALANHAVRIRNVATGQVAGNSTTSASGAFSFQGLNAGNYVVEVVDAAGKVIGTTSTISVAAGAAVTGVAVSTTAAAAAATAAAGAGSFFTSATGVLVTAATMAGIGVAVSATTKSSSK